MTEGASLKEPADVSKSGIGNEIAQCFVREGAKVVIANLNKEAAEPAARNITAAKEKRSTLKKTALLLRVAAPLK